MPTRRFVRVAPTGVRSNPFVTSCLVFVFVFFLLGFCELIHPVHLFLVLQV